MFKFIQGLICILSVTSLMSQTPTAFSCSGSDGFGYYISSASSTLSSGVLTYSNSRLSKLVTQTGNRTTLCESLGKAMNGLAFNPHDNFLYAVSRYDANSSTTYKSGTLYRIGENCGIQTVPTTAGSPNIIRFTSNNTNTVDAAGGNIGSGTFDLDNNYYVNTSFTNTSTTGFTNKIQKIKINSAGATVQYTKTLTCPTCSAGKVQVTDIIFDEASGFLYGSNFVDKKFYRIDVNSNASNAIMTEVGNTGVPSGRTILGLYKNRDGNVRAVDSGGDIYTVNLSTGAFTDLAGQATLNSGNADAASGCYAPPAISGHLFYDTNRLTDGTVNGTGTDKAGTTKMFANLVDPISNQIVKSSEILSDGTYQFLGLFSGLYIVQISDTRGVIGTAPPAQNLPSEYEWTGDNIGAGAGNDGSPDGQIAVLISNGADITEVNFGIDPMAIVPVDFTSFIAEKVDHVVLLKWQTENEINNDYFIVEKSINGFEFTDIGKVNAGAKYEFRDRQIHSSKVYFYRLRQVDFNGDYMYSTVISVRMNDRKEIEVYPSIVIDHLMILNGSQDNIDQNLSLRLHTVNGSLVLTQSLFDGENDIDVSNLVSGIYYYTIVDENGSNLKSDRIIKQ